VDRTAERLIDFCATFDARAMPEEARRHAECRVADSIACALGAWSAPPSRIARRLAFEVAPGVPAARTWGDRVRTAPDQAAFANAMAVRYLDFNDAYRNVDGCHPSDCIAPLIALGESVHAPGRTLIAAIAIAYEIKLAFADSVALDEHGWDHTVPAVIACALAGGRLLGLDRDGLAHALSLAVVPNLATHQRHRGELSMWKGGASAMAARQGVFAALLAREGMTGPSDPIEGEAGLWVQTGCRGVELAQPGDPKNAPAMARTHIKRWPVRDSCQLPIATALELKSKLNGAEIESLSVLTYRSAFRGRDFEPEFWSPQTRETADHSMPFLVTAALIDGAVTPATFDRARFLDDDILRLMARTSVEPDPEFSARAPAERNCRIEARLRDGRTVVAHRHRTSAEPLDVQATRLLVETKFDELTAPLLSPGRRADVLARVWQLDALPDVTTLVDALALDLPTA